MTDCTSRIGSGALPLEGLPSSGLFLRPPGGDGDALDELSARLRGLPIPVIGHITDGVVVLDLRCLDDMEALKTNFADA